MKKINLEDQSEARGYRAILISTQSKYLEGLHFNKNVNFNGSFFLEYRFFSHSISQKPPNLDIVSHFYL